MLHSGGFTLPPVSAVPSDEDVAQAVKLLTEEWLGDFPFASPADKANAIAVPLTMTGRMFFAAGAAVRDRRLHRRIRQGPAGHDHLPDRHR